MNIRTLIGGVILIIGFLMYQTGISIALESNPYTLAFLKETISFLQINLKNNIAIILIEYLGGIIAIIGFLICISSLSSKEKVSDTSILRKVEEKEAPPTETILKCKYCGAYIDKDDIFCAKCDRALK